MRKVSEGVFRDEYCEADDRTASEVDDVVDRDHFQVQDHRPRPFDRPGQDQRSADIAGLLLRRKRELNTKQTPHMYELLPELLLLKSVIHTTVTDKPGLSSEKKKAEL